MPQHKKISAAGDVRRYSRAGLALVLVAALLPFSAVRASSAESVMLPFPGGQAVRIIQGYNGGTHQGRSYYGLDLVLAQGGTSGAEVVSPIDGQVVWAFAPGTGNGCMGIAFVDGSYSITLCHVIFPRTYQRGESVARGQSLGTVGPPGTVGNNGTPHVHMELHRGGQARAPVPFSPPDGLVLEGVHLPASGARNEHAFRPPIVSTNAPGVAAELPPASQTLHAEQPQPPSQAVEQDEPAASAAPAPSEQAAPPASAESETDLPEEAPPARLAVVSAAGACLRVREQPSREAPIVKCVSDGTEVALTAATEQDQEYRWRQLADTGWVAAEYLRVTRAVVDGTASCLNVRERPTVDAARLGCLPDGTSVAVLEGPVSHGEHDWYRIEGSDPVPGGGWVVGRYLD